MDSSNHFDWLQLLQDSQDQDLQSGNPIYEHPAFADATRVAQAHAEFLRRQQISRASQSNGTYQQPAHNRSSHQLPSNYQSPNGQGQQRQGQQETQSPQAHQRQQYQNAPQQQYVRPSDINAAPSPYQADTSRRVHSSPNGLPPSSMPSETLAPRPNVTVQRPAQRTNQPSSREDLRKQIASTIGEAAGSQRHPMPQAPRPAAPSQIPQAQVSNERVRSANHYDQALFPTSYPLAPDRRISMPNTGGSSASSPKGDSHKPAPPSTLSRHAHSSDVPATAAQARPPNGPSASTSPPKPTAAAPTIPASSSTDTYSVTSSAPAPIQRTKVQTANMQAHSTSKTSPGPHVSSPPRKFLPHSTLSAPPRPGEHPRPPQRVEGHNLGSNIPPVASASQITQSRWTGGSTSHATPSPRPASSQQPRASDVTAPTSSAAQGAPPVSAPAQQDNPTSRTQSVWDTGTQNGHIPPGLPPVPTTKRPLYTPVSTKQDSSVSMYRPMHQPGNPPTQQPPTQGPSDPPPPAKMRRMEAGTKRAVAPSSGAINLAQYAHQSPSRTYVASRSDIVQVLDAQDAAIKESYDPTTIARDVLIATGRHPLEKPLNHHLEILRGKFSAVDLSSDLDTFRWDLVDQVGARGSITHRPPNHQQHTPSSLPVRSPYPLPSAPAPLPGRVAAFPVSYSPRPTAQPPVSSFSHSPLPPSASPLPRPPPTTDTTSAPTPRVSSARTPTPVSAPAPASTPAPAPAPAPAPPTVTVQPRKPLSTGSVSKSPQPKATPSRAASTKAPSQSPGTKSHPQPQVVISSPEAMPPIPPRKRGRGRPRKVQQNVEVAVRKEPNVPYPVFHCKWAKCQSELHNVRALEDHVLKAHVPHNVICGWEGCNAQTPKAAADMWTHLREEHIGPVVWSLGDGPTMPATGENPEGALGKPTQASVLEKCLIDMATSSGRGSFSRAV